MANILWAIHCKDKYSQDVKVASTCARTREQARANAEAQYLRYGYNYIPDFEVKKVCRASALRLS